jgi:EAL domain-containing protein (putative c-di-GMP-specific phosphodiesterase class I)
MGADDRLVMSIWRIKRTLAGGWAYVGERVNRHFVAVGALVLVLAIGGLIAVAQWLAGDQLRTAKEHSATSVAVVLARSAFEPAIAADSDHLTTTEIARLDGATRGARATQTLLGLTVFAPNGRVLYSPNHRLIGTNDDLDAVARAALRGQVTTTPRWLIREPTDTSKAARIDVHVPLADRAGHVVALFELSLPYAPIASAVASETRRLDLVLAAAGLIVFLLLFLRLRHAGAAIRTVATLQHRGLVRDLCQAIDERQLRLEYQPLAHLRNGRVRAVEALLRWDHPRRGLVSPGEFIPQAAQTDVIWPLTEHVISQAIGQAAAWREDGLDLRVSVNVPGPCLLDRRLPDMLVDLLHRARLPADRLAIELTEESVIREPNAAVEALLTLRSLGIELIALDDFGTGYSSLTRLRDLPITGLKIDRSFIVDADVNGDTTLIAAIADLAHKLGLAVVAEGIEDEATWRRMAAIGCDIGQGYWLSRPLRPEAIPEWMHGRTIEPWPQAPAAFAETASARQRARRPAPRRRAAISEQ